MSAKFPPKFAPGAGKQAGSAPASANAPPHLPPSPWAARFDLKDVPVDFGDGQYHSGVAPLFPSLDPLHCHDLPPPQPLDMPDEKSLDNLFHTEKIQLFRASGLKMWQLGALNTVEPDHEGCSEYMAHLPFHGGHSANYNGAENYRAFESQLFAIDESGWFDVWKRENWLDLDEKARPNETTPHISKWTAQDPRIWKELRIVIELGQRILDTLIKGRDEWLDTILFGEMVQMDGSAIPASWTKEIQEYCLQARPLSAMPDRGAVYEAAARQRFTELTRFAHCSFTDELDAEQSSMAWRGVTYSADDPSRKNDPTFTGASIVTLHSSLLRNLCETTPGTLTPAETSLLRFDTAITFLGDDNLNELGISFEKHLLGGPGVNFHEFADDLHEGEVHRWRSFTSVIEEEEGAGAIRSYGKAPRDALDAKAVWYDTRTEFNWQIPAFFTALLFTDQYWTDVVGKKGRNALKPPAASYGTVYKHTRSTHFSFHSAQVAERRPAAVDELRAPLLKVREALRDRMQHMAQLRPWFCDELALWQKSLWGWSSLRNTIQMFREHHARRDFRSCVSCLRAVKSNTERYATAPNEPTYETERMTYRVYWLLHLLMAASLPMLELPEQLLQTQREHYGATMANWQQIKPKTMIHYNKQKLLLSRLPDILGHQPQHPNEYLQHAADMLFPMGILSTLAPRSWVMALVSCYQDLARQRQSQQTGAVDQWADFNFDIPTYSRDAAYLAVNQSVASLSVAGLTLTPNNWPWPEPDFPRRESRAAPRYLATRNWIIIPTSNVVAEVWDPSGIPVGVNGQHGSSWQAQLRVLDTWHCGKVLKVGSGDADVVEFRRTIRSQPSRRVGCLHVWYIESELLEFDGTLSRDLYKTDGAWVYNITTFLSGATDEERKAVLAQNNQNPGYLVHDQITDETWMKLVIHRIGGLRPDAPVSVTKEPDNPLLLTWSQLRSHDNPDTGVYIAIDNIIYDISFYLEHHPAPFQTLGWLAGRDATSEFYRVHSGIGSLNIQLVAHTIRRVGRIVDEFDELTQIPADCFVLHDYMFRAGPVEQRRGYGGRDMTPSLRAQTPDTVNLAGIYLFRGQNAIAKRAPPLEPVAMISLAELAAHNDADGLGAWVAAVESDKVYDVTNVIKYPDYYFDIPLDLESCVGGHIRGAENWLRAHLSHRAQGWMQVN
ncbi:cytochrome b5 [Apiospora marii]|uniref:Cytochrome b5 n=1 Tax=Apiospora marii TaxID=335849 RepID=A0ABR1R4J3_9PEZI